jgi:hypothetical protein
MTVSEAHASKTEETERARFARGDVASEGRRAESFEAHHVLVQYSFLICAFTVGEEGASDNMGDSLEIPYPTSKDVIDKDETRTDQ